MLDSSPHQQLIFVAFIQHYHMSEIQEEGSSSIWTRKQNKLFENALADEDENAPDRWQNIAKATGKTVEEVKSHYQKLIEDLDLIESDLVPLPNYENTKDDNPKPEP